MFIVKEQQRQEMDQQLCLYFSVFSKWEYHSLIFALD